MSRFIVGIDEGTTAVKVAVFDERLRPVRAATRRVATAHPRPGRVEQDPEAVLDAVVACVAEVLRDVPGEVVACGLDHQGESVLAWEAGSGAPLTPVVSWQDKRGQPVLDALTSAGRAAGVRARSGLPLDPYFSASKLAWLLEHDSSVRAARDAGTLRLGTVDAFLADRLGAGWATDRSTASRTQLLSLGGRDWDSWLADAFGVSRELLPPLRETAGALGTLDHPSWPGPLPLTAQVCDQQAALAGSGCVARGDVKATFGTGVFVLAHAGADPPAGGPSLLPTVAWSIGGETSYALDGGVFTAGAMLEWLCASLGVAADPASLAELARSVPDASGVRVLPALAGLGAPYWRPDVRAVVSGLHGGATSAHVARAALDGIVWRVADVVAAIREHTPVEDLRIDGGLTREPLLAQLLADATGARVHVGDADATVAGAAALAGVGAGMFESIEAAAELLPAGRAVEPRTAASERADAHAAWRGFVEAASRLGGR